MPTSEKPESFRFTRDLGARLRQLRVRAGLTQAQVAELMAGTRERNQTQVSRLENGHNPNPRVKLIADYLRAVQAHFDDLSDLLRQYTGLPRVVEVEGRKRVVEMLRNLPPSTRKQADRYDIKTTRALRHGDQRQPLEIETRLKRAQNVARAARLNHRLDRLLKEELGRMTDVAETNRWVVLAPFGRKVWSRLLHTRARTTEARERSLARTLRQAVTRTPELQTALEKVQVMVLAFFDMMEKSGELDWRPAYRAPEKKRRKREPETDEQRKQRLLREGARIVTEGKPGPERAYIDAMREDAYRELVTAGMTEQRLADYRRWLDGVFWILFRTRDNPAARQQQCEACIAACTRPEEARRVVEAFTRQFDRRKDVLPVRL